MGEMLIYGFVSAFGWWGANHYVIEPYLPPPIEKKIEKNINKKETEKKVKVLRFTATWCQPCKSLEAMLDTTQTKMIINKIDIDEDNETPVTFGVRSVPTMVKLDENDNVISRITGVPTKEKLMEFLND
jgi:thioredoxin 1